MREYAGYMSTVKGNSEKTVCEYLLDLRTFFRYYKVQDDILSYEREDLEKVEISDLSIETIGSVTTASIYEFLVYTRSSLDNNSSTRMRKISALRSFYKFVHDKKHYIDSNPTVEIEPPKKASTLPKFLNVEEAVRLLETVKSDKESKTLERDYAIIVLFLNTGMRLSELVGLNLSSFDSELNTVKVLGKGNKERIIYLNNAAKLAVKSYLKVRLDPRFIRTSDKAFFLSKRQQRISNKTVQWIIYKYLDLAGLGDRGLSVHKLRHTAATLMYQSGKVDIRVLKDVLGHEQLNTTQIYTHLTSANLESAVDANPLSDVVIENKK
ncbi:MAG: tyrosine recombinase XerC [Clostridia bacterium]|nr:tyrosine recombinase XerC [Clostridia bacterium]